MMMWALQCRPSAAMTAWHTVAISIQLVPLAVTNASTLTVVVEVEEDAAVALTIVLCTDKGVGWGWGWGEKVEVVRGLLSALRKCTAGGLHSCAPVPLIVQRNIQSERVPLGHRV